MNADIIILDTEFTSWEGAQERNWSGPNEFRELVQIGAIRVSQETLEETASLDLLVKPVRNPVLSDYFIKLTGITNQHLQKNGLSFKSAMQKFSDFVADGAIYSYGGDESILNENIALHDCDNTIPKFQGKNLHGWFAEQGIDTAKICSGELARHVGASWSPPAHNALNDVRSIIVAIHHLCDKGAPRPF